MKCITHQVEMKVVPAGVSKRTGKPYNSFEACPEKGCRETFNPDSTPRRNTVKVASTRYNSTPNYAENQAKKEDGMAFLNASRGAVEIVVAKLRLSKGEPDSWIAEEIKKWTAFLYKLNTEKNFEVPSVKDDGIQF